MTLALTGADAVVDAAAGSGSCCEFVSGPWTLALIHRHGLKVSE